ncbi:MAG: hypothetical protein LBI30_01025, partial [Holosporales bacterium]|nr:hypothetical protein [Holosporales bacterium]
VNFDDFSCGLSYRVGIKLGNYFIPYVLVGMEYNFLKKDGHNPQFIGSSMVRYATAAGVAYDSMGERLAYSSDDRRIMQSPRLGAGLELEFLEHFRFRFDCLWTLRKRFNKKFTTEINPSWVANGPYFSAREHDVILRHKKFTTRFGIVMLF